MKERILWIGLGIVLLSWVGNYFYFQTKQLDHPIFFDHYYEAYVQDEASLTFYYLTNKQDPHEVSYAVIDGVEAYTSSDDDFMMWTSNPQQPQYVQEFSHYYLKSVRLEVPRQSVPIGETADDIWSFGEIQVFFSNGESMTADIGKVNIYGSLPNYETFETRVGSGSNQHRSDETMVTLKPLTVEDIKVPFADDIAEDVYIKVNLDQEKLSELEALRQDGATPDWLENDLNQEWDKVPGVSVSDKPFPIHLDQDDWMKLSMQFNPKRKSYFEFGVEIIGTTADGEPFIRKSRIIDDPFLTQQAIDEVISEKQGGAGE